MRNSGKFCIGVMFICMSIAVGELTAGSAILPGEVSPSPNASTVQIVQEYALFKQLQAGVLTVSGDVYEGSGFLVDERGIMLTCRHLVQKARAIRVQAGSQIKLQAILLAEDPTHNIAALWVNMAALPTTVILPLAKPDLLGKIMEEGEEVLAIGSSTREKDIPMLATGIVTSVQPKKILANAKVSEFHDGGPLINLHGKVVGLVHGDESVPVEMMEAILEAARETIVTAEVPSPQLLPMEPEMKFPVEALAAFVQSQRFQNYDAWISEGGEGWLLTIARNPRLRGSAADLYQFQQGKFNVLILSPLLEWYIDERDTIKAKKEEAKRLKKQAGSGIGQLSWNLSKYEDKYRSVVRILAIPEFGQTKTSFLLSGITKGVTQLEYKTSFSEMSLLCDGKEVEPINRRRFLVELPDGYGTPAGDVSFAGDYDYSFDAFDRRNCRQLEIRIASEEKAEAKAKLVPAKTVQQVWADFEGYRQAADGD